MKVKRNSFVRCLAMLLCIVMVAVLLPEPEAKAWCDDPVLVSAKKSGSAVKITWEPVIGAVKYRVFRSTDGGTTNADLDWEKDHSVTYTVTVGPQPILFTATVVEWAAAATGFFNVQ